MKKNRKILNAWCMYDWANSVHSLVIVSSIFPIYFTATAVNKQGGNIIDFLGYKVDNAALFSYSIATAFLFVSLFSPIFSAIADYSGRKKLFMQLFCYLGSVSCIFLYFFTQENITFSVFAFMFSLVGWSGSIVFYNSFLPEIATEEDFDSLSAKGFSMGYIGSVLLLIFNLTMLLKPEWYGGISEGQACRISFLTVGVWWAVFAQIPFYFLPKPPNTVLQGQKNWLWNGFRELKKVFNEIKTLAIIRQFLLSFFFYNMGVQTVMYVGTIFGSIELKLPSQSLIVTILLLQIVAIFGAWAFAKVSEKLGNTRSLQVLVLAWMGICIAAYFVYHEYQFYVLASCIGLVMGGVQSLSRSTFAKLIPDETNNYASYFSFYDVCDKTSTYFGTFLFGLITDLTGSMRNSLLFLVLIFIIGFVILVRIPSKNVYQVSLENS